MVEKHSSDDLKAELYKEIDGETKRELLVLAAQIDKKEIEKTNNSILLHEQKPINYLMTSFCAGGVVFGSIVFWSAVSKWKVTPRASTALNLFFGAGLFFGNILYLKENVLDRNVPPPPSKKHNL